MKAHNDTAWVSLADSLYTDDDIQLDEKIMVSVAEDGSGAWVRAWVWVPTPEEGV